MENLQPGDPAPSFSGTDQNGNLIRLEDFRGKRLILYFYPKDHTPGCTAEACNLRDHYSQLLNQGFAIVGISPDPLSSHQKFSSKHQLPFPLLSDESKEILMKYGAWGEKSMYGKKFMGVLRKTFVISEEGLIEKIFDKVKTADHSNQILEALNQ